MRHTLLIFSFFWPAFGQVVTPINDETLGAYKARVKTHWEMKAKCHSR